MVPAQVHAAHALASRVLVVYDSTITDSQEIAEYYQAARGIPAANMLDVDFGTVQYFLDYTASGEWPAVKTAIKNKLDALGNTTILYIVLAGNLPYQLSGMPSTTISSVAFTSISVDGAIMDIYDLVGSASAMFQANPSYLQATSSTSTYPTYASFASYRDGGGTRIYCVHRLDAPTTALAKGLVDKAIAAENAGGLSGTGYFDGRFGDATTGTDSETTSAGTEWDIYRAKGLWDAAGFTSSYDTQDLVYGYSPAPLTAPSSAIYWGWYTARYWNDADFVSGTQPTFSSVFTSVPNGAIGAQLNSSAGTNFRDASADARYWMGQAIAGGFAIVHGPIGEPFLSPFAKADMLLKGLLAPNRGYVGDAMLRASPRVKWQMFTVGDPLYQPFPEASSNPPRLRIPRFRRLS
jgi:uncharacterized protein (TIGR03790 family)